MFHITVLEKLLCYKAKFGTKKNVSCVHSFTALGNV